jgi:Ser/Thr protein kinase RdoA (MazF antagonist)
MMKLSIMKKVLNSKEHQNIVRTILKDWNLEKSEIHFIRASQNFIYLIIFEDEKFILRLTPMGNKERIQLEIDFVNYLHQNGLSVNVPIRGVDSSFINRHTMFNYSIQAVLFHYIEGTQYESDKLSDEQLMEWGKELAILHNHARQFKGGFKNPWSFIKNVENKLPRDDMHLKNKWEQMKICLMSITSELETCFIHFDFELDNLLWQDGYIHIIDFESYQYSWLVGDIAYAARDIADQPAAFDQFLKGYSKERLLSEIELKAIPIFQHLHFFYLFGVIRNSVDLDPTLNHCEWVNNLIKKLQLMENDIKEKILKYD